MKPRFFGAPIHLRVVYALIASLLGWAMTVRILPTVFGNDIWTTGAVYGALVMIPFLPSLKGIFMLRALALLFCGGLSYWAAIRATNQFDMNHRFLVPEVLLNGQWHTLVIMYLWGLGGIVGAVIVGVGVRLFVPLALRWDGWLRLVGAGFLGGLVVGLGLSVNEGKERVNWSYLLPGHIAWQVLVCLALYYGSDRGSGASRGTRAR